MVDHMRPDVTDQVNTVFMEQRVLNTQPAQQGNIMSIPRSIENEMADADWRASDQLRKPILLSQVPWKSSDAPGTNIAKFDFPEVLKSVDSLVSRTLSMYAYFRMTPVFRFQINGTKFHQGQLIMTFDMFSQAAEYADIPRSIPTNVPTYNEYYATGLPNVKVMASASDPLELEVPFLHPRNYFTTNSERGFDILGKVRATVLNQLQYGEGASPTLTLTTWLYARDATVHVPIYYHDLNIPVLKNEPVETTSLLKTVEGLIEGGSNIIGNIATGQIGKALRTGQGVVDNLGSVFGFDYPTAPLNPEKCITPIEPFAHGKGRSRAVRMALDPVSQHPTGTEESATTSDPMDIMRIVRTPMLYHTLVWSTNEPAGTRLHTDTVRPGTYVTPTLLTSGDREYVQPTYLASVSDKFRFWRGGITIDIEVVATDFHSGKLLFAFVPNDFVGTPTYQQLNSSCPSIVVDIQQASSTSFTIPYVSPTPLKYVLNGNQTRDDSILGYMYCYVQNPLVAASNVAQQVNINLYARAADDFQLLVPAPATFYTSVVAKPASAPVETTSNIKMLTNVKTEEQPTASFAFGPNLITPRPRFGENYTMLDIIKRYDKIGLFTVKSRNRGYDPLTATDYIDINPVHCLEKASERIPLNTKLAQFAEYFSAWSGSLRYKFISTASRMSDGYLTLVHHINTFGSRIATVYEEQAAGFAQVRTNLAQDNSLEVEIPFYTIYNVLLCRAPWDAVQKERFEPIINGWLGVYYQRFNNKDLLLNLDCYMAAGEDFRFYGLRPPQLATPVTYTDNICYNELIERPIID